MLAFSGPAAVSQTFYGYQTKVPEDYWAYFQQKKITAVVRLNRPVSCCMLIPKGGLRYSQAPDHVHKSQSEGALALLKVLYSAAVRDSAIHSRRFPPL